MIYFIQDTVTKAVKIGVAIDPQKRLRTFQTACPHELELLGVMKGSYPEEAELHQRFACFRIRGEWFRGDEEFLDAIDDLFTRCSPTDTDLRCPVCGSNCCYIEHIAIHAPTVCSQIDNRAEGVTLAAKLSGRHSYTKITASCDCGHFFDISYNYWGDNTSIKCVPVPSYYDPFEEISDAMSVCRNNQDS